MASKGRPEGSGKFDGETTAIFYVYRFGLKRSLRAIGTAYKCAPDTVKNYLPGGHANLVLLVNKNSADYVAGMVGMSPRVIQDLVLKPDQVGA